VRGGSVGGVFVGCVFVGLFIVGVFVGCVGGEGEGGIRFEGVGIICFGECFCGMGC
jgi:hypothetical protein